MHVHVQNPFNFLAIIWTILILRRRRSLGGGFASLLVGNLGKCGHLVTRAVCIVQGTLRNGTLCIVGIS